MNFRTEYSSSRSLLTLNPRLPVVLAGSCFSQNISSKMREHQWPAVLPAGTLYNPLSIAMALEILSDKINGIKRFENSLFLSGELWSSWLFDSSFASIRKEDCIEEFKLQQKSFIENLEAGGVLIVTFGTSICYFLEAGQEPVGNCHKQPSSLFFRRRLTVEEITKVWQEVTEKLRSLFPDLKIIFTVSPVRHLKDGFTGNSRSKAILQLSIEEICETVSHTYYFPAYEIINDDLRDYRFYAADLVHPSDEAIEYVWQKFIETFLDPPGVEILKEGLKKYKLLHHRPRTGALGKSLNVSSNIQDNT